MQNYASLQETHEQEEEGGVIYHVAEPTNSRWNHIDDLDTFFTRMYKYHQKHGFLCILLQEIFELNQFVFVVMLTTYLLHGVNYSLLFRNEPLPQNATKVTLHDVLLPINKCFENFHTITWFILVIASIVWLLKLLRGFYQVFHFWDVKHFYNSALGVKDSDLDNLTWHEVQDRIKRVQIEHQMCIHKRELTNLDIYHRILRQENYLVAMVNKRLLPPCLKVPFVGEIVYWSQCLRFNVMWLLFWSPWSPFEHPWHLRDEYKKANMREELSGRLARNILYLALLNLVFAPIILLWQILYAFFNYTEILRREPGQMGIRRWSLYGQLYLRHFNELDHELHVRLTKAYRPATRYMAVFNSPTTVLIAEHLSFICSAIFAILVALTVYDEDVLAVEHLLTIMTLLGVLIGITRAAIPDDTIPCNPEPLLYEVVKDTHYLPQNWQGHTHTARVRGEFQQLFQYRVVGLLEELLSPILTPFVLYYNIHPKALDIIDFFRNFTVSVMGVGDVCSFAQLDIRKHGNPNWQDPFNKASEQTQTQYMQAEDGKTELSLIHFASTNPDWEPPPQESLFVRNLTEETTHESLPLLDNTRQSSLRSMPLRASYIGDEFGQQLMQSELTLREQEDNMIRSTLFLHNRNHKQTIRFAEMHPQESTPLLFSGGP